MNFLIALVCILFVSCIVAAILKHFSLASWYNDHFEHEHEVTTTTTVYHNDPSPRYETVGDLVRQTVSNGQTFVYDPVDGQKCYLNSNDDLYEDAEGKIWKIV